MMNHNNNTNIPFCGMYAEVELNTSAFITVQQHATLRYMVAILHVSIYQCDECVHVNESFASLQQPITKHTTEYKTATRLVKYQIENTIEIKFNFSRPITAQYTYDSLLAVCSQIQSGNFIKQKSPNNKQLREHATIPVPQARQ